MDALSLVYLNNRHYDPTTGTFISVDPLVTMTGEPYIYGSANPATKSDPSGLCSMISGDLWCGSGNITRAEECVFSTSCSVESTRSGFETIRYTTAGKTISAGIDVANQGDWGKLDGNWSAEDVASAAAGTNLLSLFGNQGDASVVQNVAGALLGHDSIWEQYDTDLPTWWDRNGGAVLAVAQVGLSVAAFATPCSALCAVGAAGAASYSAHDTCSGGGSGIQCSVAVANAGLSIVTAGASSTSAIAGPLSTLSGNAAARTGVFAMNHGGLGARTGYQLSAFSYNAGQTAYYATQVDRAVTLSSFVLPTAMTLR